MGKSYDAIVIGAGLGGLSAATYLAKKGKKVLLLEKHNVPGGYATSFVRGRYEFETALHELSDVGVSGGRGSLGRYLDLLGVSKKVEFIESPSLYRSVFPGVDITLPKGREDYIATLADAFPAEADGVRVFMGRVFKLFDELAALEKVMYDRTPRAIPAAASALLSMRAMPRYLFSTWGSVLDRDVKDPRVKAIISQYWGYFGLPPSKVSFFYFAVALASYITIGATYIKGRSQALSNAFISTFTELGGDVEFNAEVERITVSNGRASGVALGDGREFSAKLVVSNADPVTTVRKMIARDRVPDQFLRRLSATGTALSSLNVYLGAARPFAETVRDHEVFINDNLDLDAHYAASMRVGPPMELAATCYNSVWPEISEPGTSIIVLTALVHGAPWRKVPPADYMGAKRAIAETMIGMAERVFPGLRESAEVVSVSTPLTNMRYTGNLDGSIYGFVQTPQNHTILRMPPKGPIAGLYFAGAWTRPGGGFSPAMLSGQMTVEEILMRKELN